MVQKVTVKREFEAQRVKNSPCQPSNNIGVGNGTGGLLLPRNTFGEGGEATYPKNTKNPPTFVLQCLCETVNKLGHKCTNLSYVTFILFEGTSKSILSNSIINSILLYYQFSMLEM